MAKAWETVGTLRSEFLGQGFRGRGAVLAGVHDSNANYLRYLAAGQELAAAASLRKALRAAEAANPLGFSKDEMNGMLARLA